MPSVDDRLRHVSLKLGRAKQHIGELERELRRFLDTNPYEVGAKHDPHTRKLIYYIERADPVPDAIPLLVGDALQNLMGALDHMAYQLVCSDTADNPPNRRGIYFPIADDVAKYEAKKKTQLEGAHQETVAAVDALKPYKGGAHALWILQRLNSIEKHRLLLTVGSQAAGVHLGQLLASLSADFFPAKAGAALDSMNLYIKPADTGFPLAPGFELYIGKVDEKPNPKQKFSFDVALNEPGVVEGQPLIKTVNDVTAATEAVVMRLKGLLK